MTELLRFLALYGWHEDFDLAKHPDVLVRFVEDARIKPNKLTVYVPKENKERRRTLYKKSRLIDVVAPFTSYDWIALDEPIDRDFRNVRSHLNFDQDSRHYLLAKTLSEWALADVVRHFRLLCEFVTPRYGFSHVERGLAAISFPFGISTTSLSREAARRAHDLGHSLRRTSEHLKGRLHDVYGLNVLSQLHLDRMVRGQMLRDWIGDGERGELLSIKEGVFVWTVPDEVRADVRATLFQEGALIATV